MVFKREKGCFVERREGDRDEKRIRRLFSNCCCASKTRGVYQPFVTGFSSISFAPSATPTSRQSAGKKFVRKFANCHLLLFLEKKKRFKKSGAYSRSGLIKPRGIELHVPPYIRIVRRLRTILRRFISMDPKTFVAGSSC